MLAGPERDLVEARQASFGRTQGFEGIERGYPRPPLLHVDPRIGDDHALARGADPEAERETLGRNAIGLGDEPARRQRTRAARVEEDRVLNDLPREEPLGEAGDEDDVERETARGLRRRHEHRPVAPARRPHGERAQARAQHELDLVERHRTDRRHRRELRERREHLRRIAERLRRERAEARRARRPSCSPAPRRPSRRAINGSA